jgi:hypothetical protein
MIDAITDLASAIGWFSMRDKPVTELIIAKAKEVSCLDWGKGSCHVAALHVRVLIPRSLAESRCAESRMAAQCFSACERTLSL